MTAITLNPTPVVDDTAWKATGQRVSPVASQDPIFDHANATKTAVTASATVLTVPAGCYFARISGDGDFFLRTDGEAAADAAGSLRVIANQPEIIPVTPGAVLKAFASVSVVVRVTPLKVRP